MEEGVVDIIAEDSPLYNDNDIVEIWRWRNNSREKEDIRFGDILSLNSISEYITKTVSVEENDLSAVIELIKVFSVENCFYDFQETTVKRERNLSEAEPLYITVKKAI